MWTENNMSKACVMVTGIGNNTFIDNAKKYAYPIIKKYFNKNNYETFLIEDTKYKDEVQHPSWLWLKCHELIPGFDYILTWNIDILPVKIEDNIFSVIDQNMIGASCDLEYQNVKEYPNFKYNCGMVGVPKNREDFCNDIYNRYKSNPFSWPSYEQYYVNMELHKQNIPVFEIPNKYNYYFNHPNFENATCWHYTNKVHKSQVIELFKHHYRMIIGEE